MTDKQKYMVEGMDKLLKRFNKFPDEKAFTVEEIIEISNDVYDSIIQTN